MSDQDTSTTGDGGPSADTSTEDNAASQLLATWVNEGDKPEGQGDDGKNGTGGEAQDVKSLPEWAQKLISETRSEAAKNRTGRNEAEQKYQGTLDAIAQALGLKEDEKPDPDQLAKQLSEQQSHTREAQVQLAVYRRGIANGANPEALLDSASFLRSLSEVDPTQQDAVDAAIKAAVEKNPTLAVQEERRPAPSFGGGPRKTEPARASNLGEAIRNKIAAGNS